MQFPVVRMRRRRKNGLIRDLLAETRLNTEQLVYPLFVCDRPGAKTPVSSMPGVYQQSIDHVIKTIETGLDLGVSNYLLFGIPDAKDAEATSAWQEDGVVQSALIRLREEFGNQVFLITDVCLCEYTNHGHCGIVMDGKVINDPTVERLARVAVSHAEAGADMVAPSDMMDGRISWIRDALDDEGFLDMPIMAYAVKYASGFYAPFREAAESAPAFGDRRAYQMDYRNAREAIEEANLDILEGADIILVKPALAYLDIVTQLRQNLTAPIAAYSVSGEYSMIKAAAQNDWIDERAVVMESLTAMKRAGADILITYHALDVAGWLKD